VASSTSRVYGCAREGTTSMLFEDMNWLAVIVGAALAFGLGMIWFSPVMFGRAWAAGSHGINPPASLPITAMLIQGLGTLALALVVGLADTGGLIGTAILAILAARLLVAGMDLFSQKTGGATLIDAGYIAAMGAIMILAQLLFRE
jgi:hypothetical protein